MESVEVHMQSTTAAVKVSTRVAFASASIFGVCVAGEIGTGIVGSLADSESRVAEAAQRGHQWCTALKVPSLVVGSVASLTLLGAVAHSSRKRTHCPE